MQYRLKVDLLRPFKNVLNPVTKRTRLLVNRDEVISRVTKYTLGALYVEVELFDSR